MRLSQLCLIPTPRSRLPRVLSYGGGLDSFAMLVEALRRREVLDFVVFCDVGDGDERRDGEDPGEWPGTYRHIREVVIPLCKVHGIKFVWLSSREYPVRDARSLFAWFKARGQIPVAGPDRVCTAAAKVERFERWLADNFGGEKVEVWIGFDASEKERAANDPNLGKESRKPRPDRAIRVNRFPLIEWEMCRCRCEALVRSLGHAVPRKSACTFCPYASRGDWQRLARELPTTFEQIVQLEASKPLTRPGKKLSIMGFSTLDPLKSGEARTAPHVLRDLKGVEYVAPPLPVWIQGDFHPKVKPCEVCGAANRATKAAGCDYLEPAAAQAA